MKRSGPQPNSNTTIRRQITLPWSKAISISVKSIRVRLARNLLTMGGVILAIAFFVNVWATRHVVIGLGQSGNDAIQLKLTTRGEAPTEQNAAAADSRAVWLISLSLMVCVVGITNAMLMSVTERYREIGTMKCLGAMDGFIIKLFLIESAFMGGVGSLLGAAIGLTLVLLDKLWTYGAVVFVTTPWFAIVKIVVVAFSVGVLLSTAAALYPAFRASRLQPVAAMRMEE